MSATHTLTAEQIANLFLPGGPTFPAAGTTLVALTATEAQFIHMFRLVELFQRGPSAPSSAPTAGQPAASLPPELAAKLDTLIQEVQTLSTTTSNLAQKEQQLADVIAGLRTDLDAANVRVQAHEAAQSAAAKAAADANALQLQAINDLNAEMARLKALPTDTTAIEAVLASAIDNVQQARTVTQTIGADPASGTGSDNTAGGAGGNTTVAGGAGTDTTSGGAGGNTTVAGGAGTDTTSGGAGGAATVTGGAGTDTTGGGASGAASVSGGGSTPPGSETTL